MDKAATVLSSTTVCPQMVIFGMPVVLLVEFVELAEAILYEYRVFRPRCSLVTVIDG